MSTVDALMTSPKKRAGSLTEGFTYRMVTEDVESVCAKTASCDVHDARQELSRNLVHVGNHQEKTLDTHKFSQSKSAPTSTAVMKDARTGKVCVLYLGGCKSCGKSTSLERTMKCSSSTSLTLHLCDGHALPVRILELVSRPLIDHLAL